MGVPAVAAMVVGVLLDAAQTAVMASEVSVGSPSRQTPRRRVLIPSASRAA
jgi:hypothetical protein